MSAPSNPTSPPSAPGPVGPRSTSPSGALRAGATFSGPRRDLGKKFAYPTWLFGYVVGIGMGTIWGLGLALYIH